MFREEVEARRAHDAKEKLEESLVKRYPVTIANGVEALMTETTMNFLGVERAPEAPTP
jgi:hypothetical protein